MPPDEIEVATVAGAWVQARFCSEGAERASKPEDRALFIHLRNSWIQVANELQIIEGVKRARRIRMKLVAARR
jgi:hypothetical protein